MTVKPYETLFSLGESSEPGIFIVLEGGLGVYLSESEKLRLITVLEPGESIGDFDILDGKFLLNFLPSYVIIRLRYLFVVNFSWL